MRASLRATTVVVSALLVLLGLRLCAQLGNLDAASWQQGSKNAEPLISALSHYKQDHGTYPKSLSSLTPKYLATIPRPAVHYDYEYVTCDDEYMLVFEQPLQSYYGYNSKADEWGGGDDIRPPPYQHYKDCMN